MQIVNPILPGFHADPCICRKGDDYYIAVSSFEWFPGIPVYHSRDMKHWELYTHVLTEEKQCDLKGLPSAKGIWAPCLTYCQQEDLFYVVFGVMHSMNARYFDVDNYVITARDIRGPWSEPVYLHSSGFDASMLHDDDGRKWLVALDWETRPMYEKPGQICIVEYDPAAKKIKGIPQRIWRGATDRGCLEAPHLTKRNGWYYLMCAEGGTGYYHGVTMARSRSPFGPYEADPTNPIVTAVPENHNERADVDHLKPRYYNPETYLQKCGHGSYVETTLGETYLVHLCSRPFQPELRCTLGRETAIQKMQWTQDGWLRMADGGNLAQTVVECSALPDWEPAPIPAVDDFDQPELGVQYYAPRIPPKSFCDLRSRPGWLRMRGQESGTSLNKVSLLTRKLTSVNAEMVTKMEFTPQVYQQSAGLILYYDNMNYAYLRKYYSQTLGCPAIAVQRMNNGNRIEYEMSRCAAPEGALWMKLRVKGREAQFSWSSDGKNYESIGPAFDTSEFSDEYSQFGEFTGCFAGITCADRMTHEKYADFDFLSYVDLQPDLLYEGQSRNREHLNADKVQKNLRHSVQKYSVDLHESERHHNSYEQEHREQECIRRGDIEGLYRSFQELDQESVGITSDDPLRNLKNIGIAVITLAARSAIAGGLPAETAFSMSDTFIRQIEARSAEILELQIIPPELYEAAQHIREARSNENRKEPKVPLNTKGEALLAGNVYCGHCGARLLLTTNGRYRKLSGGLIDTTQRVRYICYGKTRKQTQCDGPTGYTMHLLDDKIDTVIHQIFNRMKGISKSKLIAKRYEEEIAQRNAHYTAVNAAYSKAAAELADLKGEIIKSIRGESAFPKDVLAELISESETKCSQLSEAVETARQKVSETEVIMKELHRQHDEIISFAELYDSAGIEAKKMVVSAMIRRVEVSRDYRVKIYFNFNLDQYLSLMGTGVQFIRGGV